MNQVTRMWMRRFPRAAWTMALALAAVALMGTGSGLAQEPVQEEGLFITVPNPIKSEQVNWIRAKVQRALDGGARAQPGPGNPARHVTKIVFDFNYDNAPSHTPDYGVCYDLSKFLLGLPGIKTIAYVHNDVTGHAVLPVLSCKEIVMSSDAKLGNVAKDQAGKLGKDQVLYYTDVAMKMGRSPALVEKMFDKESEVLEATRRGAVWYIDGRREKEAAAEGIVVTRREPVLPAGVVGMYSASQAQKFGMCNLIAESRQDVASAYQMPAAALRGDPLEGRLPVAMKIDVRGQVNEALAETLMRRIRKAIGQKHNLIVLQLNCGGGDTIVARKIADFLRTLRDDEGGMSVMTVAYIPERAPDTATFLALGCTEIAMRPKAEIGDFENVVYEVRGQNKVEAPPARYAMKRESLMGLADVQGYPVLLARGMLDKSVAIYWAKSKKGQSEWRLVTDQELREDLRGEEKWGDRSLVKAGDPQGQFLKLDGKRAQELGLAREVVEDVQDLCTRYGISDLRNAGPDWLDDFAAFLRHPATSVFLIMVGVASLILIIKIPGVGLAEVVAALCFVLYFWSHSQIAGQIFMLAVLLFVLGLILIGLEVFVIPGFGIAGISGILLVLSSLVLVTLEKKPETSQEWLSVGRTIGQFSAGFCGAVVLAGLVAWYLPSIPYASRLVLRPPAEGDEALGEDLQEPGAGGADTAALAALLGAIGVAITPLRPAGIARIGEDFVDVVAEGSFVAEGSQVQVVEIEGHRVVVKEI